MGNEVSSTRQMDEFMSKYLKLKEYRDERYGEITIYGDTFNKSKLVITKEHWATSFGFTNDEKLLRKIRQNRNEFLPKFLGHFIQRDSQFCSDHEKHTFIIEFPYRTLKKEFDFLKKKKMKILGLSPKKIMKEVVSNIW